MGAKATYVYCAVQARHEPNLGRSRRRAPSGLAGLGKLRLLDAGRGLWLVVADAPLSRYGEASIQRGLENLTWLSRCAVAHEAVIEHCLRAPGVVPMKLFTIFDSDVSALAEIGRKRPQLDRLMRLVAGRREWGVRIRAVPAPSRLRTVRPVSKPLSTGASYLAAKKHARDTARELAEREHARVNRTFATLAALAVDARRHPPVAGAEHTRLILDAAFLVGTRAAAGFRALTRRVARDLGRNGYGVEVTGPWPPYNFIES
jgi:hypothetical protein